MTRGFGLILLLVLCIGCPLLPPVPGQPETSTSAKTDLDSRYEALLAASAPFGEGGREVLDVAYRALREGQAEGRWPLVGLEDLWAEAIKEGTVLFNKPDRRWGLTTADETADMLGQNTIGPWQITVRNVRHIYGRPYGVEPDWPDAKVYAFCRDNPEVQAGMIADYIQEAYEKHGRRGPYGIQRYFSLKGFVRGDIGLAAWDESVLPVVPYGDPTLVTPGQKANTGFYAKQLLLGTRTQPHGLVYWLWVTGDLDAIRETLRVWRDQRCFIWDDIRQKPLLTSASGGFAIGPGDLKYLAAFPECRDAVWRLVREVLAEQERTHERDRTAPAGGSRREGGVVHLEPGAGP